jgi:L-alanine-DL-glutamate epimerase-like enolase superfamily enzyme
MGFHIRQVTGLKVFFIPVNTRMPLKFGSETLCSVTCLRVCMGVVDTKNRHFEGWGETPLSVQWVWPSSIAYSSRHETLKRFCTELASAWISANSTGHALEVGYDFQAEVLPQVFSKFNERCVSSGHSEGGMPADESMPWLAALVCNSAFDIALHDAFGRLAGRPVYDTYRPEFLERDLAYYLEADKNSSVSFVGQYPADYLSKEPKQQLLAWHLVGGLDPLDEVDLTGEEPNDGYPVILSDWIRRDGLKCLKIKLRGTDHGWDYQRVVRIGRLALPLGVEWLTADFNCTVQHPDYVNQVLDELQRNEPALYQRILYVEQPFPYDLERHRIDVYTVSKRKPLFLDESAHDWRMVRLGRELGWTGVALKTCKTQTGALLSACWARAHGMELMVQDLTNPMLAQIPHVLLAANVGTIMGVETNSMQFYPEASAPEAQIHPGIYRRRDGKVDLSSTRGPGFGYRLEEIHRALPEPALQLH